MPVSDTATRLRKCFTAVFPKLPEANIETASTENLPEWDSVATVNMLSVIEEEFGVALDFEDLESLTSFERILSHLNEKGASG